MPDFRQIVRVSVLTGAMVICLSCSLVTDSNGDGEATGFFISGGVTQAERVQSGSPESFPSEGNLIVYDLNHAVPGGTPTERKFYVFGAWEERSVFVHGFDVSPQGQFRIEARRLYGWNAVQGQTIVENPSYPIALGKYDTLEAAIVFAPETTGNHAAVVKMRAMRKVNTPPISHSVFHVQGNAIPASPEISIWNQGYELFNLANAGYNDYPVRALSMHAMGCQPAFNPVSTYTVKNFGATALEVSEIAITGNKGSFVVEGVSFPLSIPAGEKRDIPIRLLDQAPGLYSAIATVRSDDQNERRYQFSIYADRPEPKGCAMLLPHDEGSVPAAPVPGASMSEFQFDLGPFGAGEDRVTYLLVYNSGDAPLILDDDKLVLESPNWPDCGGSVATSVDWGAPFPITVNPGDTHEITLTFNGSTCNEDRPYQFRMPVYWRSEYGPYIVGDYSGEVVPAEQAPASLAVIVDNVRRKNGDTVSGGLLVLYNEGEVPLLIREIRLRNVKFFGTTPTLPDNPTDIRLDPDQWVRGTVAVAVPNNGNGEIEIVIHGRPSFRLTVER